MTAASPSARPPGVPPDEPLTTWRRVVCYACLTLGGLVACAAPLHAQGAGAACPIQGRVTRADGAPVAGATVRARLANAPAGPAATAVTAADGRFCVALRAAGEVVVEVERGGFVGRTLLLAVGARTADVQLAPDGAAADTVRLAALVARAPRPTPRTTRRGAPPGGDLASLPGGEAALYPGAPGDLAASAGVSGQFLPVRGQDLSIEGQVPSANRTTLDGAGFDARDVPAEGLAAAGVFAHPYDVSRGQFTGGEVAGRTMGGTNLWGGGVRLSLQPGWLTGGGAPQASWGAHSHQEFLSAGGGGPILPGRLFVYAAAQADRRTADASGLSRDAAGLPGYGIAADSLHRFFDVLQGLGVDAGAAPTARLARSGSALARFDYLASPRHSLMLRLDARGRESSGGAGSPFSTAAAAREESTGGGALAQLTSRMGPAENEATARWSAAGQGVRRAYQGPAGQVWVGSAGGGALSGGSLAFGGEPLGFPRERRAALELGDRMVVSRGAHLWQVGGTWQWERVTRAGEGDRMGTFTFATLADLEAGRPLRFTRSLGGAAARVSTGYAAAYAGDVWKPAPGLRVVLGVRGERYGYAGPADSAGAAAGFGLRTVPAAGQWGLSPRAGFTWYRATPTAQLTVLGGAGLFRGAAPTREMAAMLAGGSGGATLICVGRAVPAPRWDAYRHDASAIPTACAGEAGGAAGSPGVTGFTGAYAAPRVWHSSLGASWLHTATGTGVDLRLSTSRGRGAALAGDLNLAADPRFVLGAEAGRPVFAPAAAFDPASGQVSPGASRRDGRFATVRGLGAGGRTSVRQASIQVSRLAGTTLVELFYTYTRSRDQATGLAGPGGGWASTAADPRVAEWASSDFEQRHAFQLSAIHPLGRWGNLTAIARLVSGAPFTPMVDGDVNGDGLANDRAFVFDPARTADPVLRAGLLSLLGDLHGPARACLLRQAGAIAARNSCRTPWGSFADVQLNLFPGGPRNKRLVVNVAAQNVTSGLDYLLHGSAGLRGWGQYPSADPVLLRAVGFDPARRELRYQVNPGFGPDAGRSGRVPFSLRVQARITVGADPATQALVAQAVASHDRLEPRALRAEMLRLWANAPAAALAADSARGLGLAPAQAAALRAAADTVNALAGALAGELAETVTDLGASDPAAVRTALVRQRELLARAQGVLDGGLAAVRQALTPAQWARLPVRLRAGVQARLPISPQGGVRLLPDF